jgi:purine-nucleoside phosphorylase
MKKTLFASIACVAIALVVSLGGCAAATAQKGNAADAQSYDERLVECRKQIEAKTDFRPQVVIVLGSNLGDFVKSLDVKQTIPYKDIEGWPMSTAPDHAGNLVFAEYHGLKLAVMQGRLHGYEGYSEQEVVLPLRVLHLLGADTAILSNATGSLNPDFKVGEFVCVEDQISSFVSSPLIGQNNDELGKRFVPMTDAFDKDMRDAVLKVGEQSGIPVHSGVYIQVSGPQFETPAEIRMYRSLGADTVAMSMADEVIAARHMGMKVCAINCISNMAAGMEEEGFTEDTVGENMKAALTNFQTLVYGLLDTLGK